MYYEPLLSRMDNSNKSCLTRDTMRRSFEGSRRADYKLRKGNLAVSLSTIPNPKTTKYVSCCLQLTTFLSNMF